MSTPADHQQHHIQLPRPAAISTTTDSVPLPSSSFNIAINNSNNAAIYRSNRTTLNHYMAGQTPVLFGPATHCYTDVSDMPGALAGPGQDYHHPHEQLTLHAVRLVSNQLMNSQEFVDFKEVEGGEEESSGEQRRERKAGTFHTRYEGRPQAEYDPGPGTVQSTEDDMTIEYDRMERGEYEGGLMMDLIKKGGRRLGYDQVKALEKAFEVENRLEPERKARLASQLGLQPRQVAVWFQNRRARWKTKQMERDFTLLKHNFQALKEERDKLVQDKLQLQAELARLKAQMVEGKTRQLVGEARSDHPESSPTNIKGSPPAMASGSLVVDAHHCSEAAITMHPDYQEDDQEEELLEEEASPKPVVLLEGKLPQNDSLSSNTEESDIQNDHGTIEDSISTTLHGNKRTQASTNPSKSVNEEHDYLYARHWKLPSTPSQLFKPTIKAEEYWPEQGSFNMNMDTWCNW